MSKNNNFKPKIKFYELACFFERGKEVLINNTKIYLLVKKITNVALPTTQDKYEKMWENFYLPVKRRGKLISVPFGIKEYKAKFYVFCQGFGYLTIGAGKEEIEGFYKNFFLEAIRFLKIIRKTKGEIIRKTVPYDIRTGKIKGKYIMDKAMSKKEKTEIVLSYKKHLEKKQRVFTISLNNYLDVAAICYRAVFRKKAFGFSPMQMYKRWADSRDGGMLSLKDKNSKKEFMNWLEGYKWVGCHPFEIVFSWIRHGIHLYPPRKENPYYSLRVTNYDYAEAFLNMAKALIGKNVPFQAMDFDKVLEYLTGESYFRVNEFDDNFFFYEPSREFKKLYFKHVEWDELKIVS